MKTKAKASKGVKVRTTVKAGDGGGATYGGSFRLNHNASRAG